MTLPPAPYPATTRAKGWRFELDYEQVEQSDTWDLANEIPMAQPALLMMWMVAWRQVPCGSLPADEAVIRSKCRVPPELWQAMRDVCMRGWYEADDGRLYHPTITKRVLEMLGKRRSDADRKAADRAKKALDSDVSPVVVTPDTSETPLQVKPESSTDHRPPTTDDPRGAAPPLSAPVPSAPTPLPPASGGASPPPAPRKRAAAKPKADEPAKPTVETWSAYSAAYRDRYHGQDPVRNATVNGQLAQFVARIGAEEAPAVARFYVGHQRSDYVRSMHDVGLMLRDAAGLRTQWATQRQVTTTQAQQADRTATNMGAFGPMIAEARQREAAEAGNG